jgi:hypothetical protein
MDIGRAKIVVAVTMPMGMTVAMMVVVVRFAKQPRTDQIDGKAQRRDQDGLAIRNRDRVNEANRAFVSDLNRDHRKDDRAGKGREIAELAGAEGESGITRLPTGEQIRDGGNPKCCGVGCHVPAIDPKYDPATISPTIMMAVMATTNHVRRSLRAC